ncbi:iron-siderophore ABC transporter substrate-binding protein [Nodularia sphaerocarpa]|uniref:iron-siderophore ABC transporter substrate-binding protein n=1 Tax=Nodularia sphaerocarpa TaxID=137816 RepID=UPI001EFB8DF2|nr:iron-siderophore ABC transporter substrate-binding protein [Nodularia sphaerocarpa]MDB9372631.1 iron-siderophore ABC transporter substrate-binding protein [Nodularia sphaerocarpa CS-585]ULP71137.1 putative siderophore-binding lipoprotein YfiY [Nodularia sphaerocarpa UHCC 0038]
MNDSYIKFKSLTRWWGFGIVLFCTLLLSVACHHGGSLPVNEQIANTACRDVEHAAGITCVPDKFERLVTLDDAENAIALGIKPVGAVISDFSLYWQDQLTGVKNIGKIGEPNLESILALKPDLIAGFEYQKDIYPLTSKIAPTVLFEFGHSGKWKEVFTNISVALGKKEVGQQVMENYYQRLKEFKQQMGKDLSKIKVSVVRVYPDKINLYLLDSFCGIVLQDAGLSRPESQKLSGSEAEKLFGNPIQVSIGNELIEKADGDVIFIWTAENITKKGNKTAQKNLEQLKSNPLWQNLKAVQENKVYVVPSYWIGSGMLAANAIIDDLFKYLINQS